MTNRRSLLLRLSLVVLIAGVASYLLRSCNPDTLPVGTEEAVISTPGTPAKPKTPAFAAPEAEDPSRKKQLPDEATIGFMRSRVRLNLSAIYTAEKVFFGDYQRYSSDLFFIGWTPHDIEMNFKLGFLQEYRPRTLVTIDGTVEDPSRMDSDEYLQIPFANGGDFFRYSKEAEQVSLFDYEKFCRQRCVADAKGFEVLVVLPLGESGQVDVWSISDKKSLRQLWDGVAQKVPSTNAEQK